MVATQLLISLCLTGLVASAPQVNQNNIVEDVVVALGPSISAAVAEALRGLRAGNDVSTTRVTTTKNTGFSSGGNAGSSAGFGGASSSFGGASSVTTRQQNTAAGFSAGGSSGSSSRVAAEEVNTRPEYNFAYQVANDEAQTYISQEEARNGDDVVGTYSYVDPTGALVTVNYQAGLDGYSQTVDKQEGFVEVRARPVKVQETAVTKSNSAAAQTFNSGASQTASRPAQANRFSAVRTVQTTSNAEPQVTSGQQVTTTTTSSQGSSLDQSALIAQIISALQPSISAAVNSAVGSQGGQQTTVVRRVSQSASGDNLTPLFGN